MKNYVTKQNITALAGISVLCILALLSVGFSPAFAATLSRSADLGTTLSIVRSMIYPLCAIKLWVSSFGAGGEGRWIRSFPCLDR